MPIPKPTPTETEKEFLQRCMTDPTMVSEYKNTDQRYAICSRNYFNLLKLYD